MSLLLIMYRVKNSNNDRESVVYVHQDSSVNILLQRKASMASILRNVQEEIILNSCLSEATLNSHISPEIQPEHPVTDLRNETKASTVKTEV